MLRTLPPRRPLPALCRASDKCQRERRKTVNGDDLLWAMETLGFDDYVGVSVVREGGGGRVVHASLCFCTLIKRGTAAAGARRRQGVVQLSVSML